MNLVEILGISGGGVIVFILSLIKIPKLEVNIWGWIAGKLGKALNADMYSKVADLSSDIQKIGEALEKHIKSEEEEKVRAVRKRILNFNDEDFRGVYHSKEHFEEILGDIDHYEDYCANHPTYSNNKAVLAIENIKTMYAIKLRDGSF